MALEVVSVWERQVRALGWRRFHRRLELGLEADKVQPFWDKDDIENALGEL